MLNRLNTVDVREYTHHGPEAPCDDEHIRTANFALSTPSLMITVMPSKSIHRRSQTICWQGWQLRLPRRWSPARLDGDFSAGYALFSDSIRPRLGLRWTSPRRKPFDVDDVKAALANEVGTQESGGGTEISVGRAKWEVSAFAGEVSSPDRAVWIGISKESGRMLQIVYHTQRRERVLDNVLIPTVNDNDCDRAMAWSVFDLNCIVPAGMKLVRHQLNAGDLSLTFAERSHSLMIRQVAMAQLALARLPLEKWVIEQQSQSRFHRAIGSPVPIELSVAGNILPGQAAMMIRRPLGWLRRQPAEYHTCALHDAARDRLIILHASEEGLLREVAKTVGLGDRASP